MFFSGTGPSPGGGGGYPNGDGGCLYALSRKNVT